jgi:hypothetical protein
MRPERCSGSRLAASLAVPRQGDASATILPTRSNMEGNAGRREVGVIFVSFATEAVAMLVVASYCGFTSFAALRQRRFGIATLGAFCTVNALAISAALAWASFIAPQVR